MPNIKSQVDRAKQSKKENLHNKAIKSDLRTTIKKAENAIADLKENKDLPILIQELDLSRPQPTDAAGHPTFTPKQKELYDLLKKPHSAVLEAEIALHKAASKKVITRKTASRKTSRLHRRLNGVFQGYPGETVRDAQELLKLIKEKHEQMEKNS